jgi:hypothetical protein
MVYEFGDIDNSGLIDNRLLPLSMEKGIRLRKEFFGGIVFDPKNGNTLEVDRDAFQLVIC